MLADVTTGGRAGAAERLGYSDTARIIKAAVGATQLSELPDVIAASNAWVGSLRNSAFDVMTRYMRQVPRRARTGIMSAVGSTEVEGAAKAISKLGLDFGSLTEAKAVAFVVATKETVEAEDFDLNMLGDELRGAVQVAQDSPFVAALEAGVSPVASVGNFESDVRGLLGSVPRGADSRPVFIGSPEVRDEASLQPEVQRRGGRLPVAGGDATLLDVPYVSSDALSPGELLLVDASRIAYWADPLAVSMAQHASIEMDSDPSGQSTSPPTGSNLVSLWQTNSVGFKAERRFAVRKLSSDAVAKLTGVAQGSPVVNW